MTGHRTILYRHYVGLMMENKNQNLKNNLYLTNNVVNGGFKKKTNKMDVNTIIKVGLLKEVLEILHFRLSRHVGGHNCVCFSLIDLY